MNGENLCFILLPYLATETCEFLIEEIQGFNILTQLNRRIENLIEMAERMGHKDICTLFESFMKKQK